MFKAIAMLAAVFALGQFHRASGAVFSPILIDQYAFSASAIGALVSAMFFASIIAQPPFGSALDRYGPARVLSAALICCALGAALFAVGDDYATLFAARALIGAGLAASSGAQALILAQSVPNRDYGYASGLIVTIGAVGGMTGAWPLALALEQFGWVPVFMAVAVATTGLGAVIFAFAPGRPAPAEEGAATIGYRELLRDPELRRIFALAFVAWAPITAISGLWGGPYLQQIHGFDPDDAGLALLSMFAATMASAYFYGRLDRGRLRRKRIILTGVCAAAIPLGVLAVIPTPPAAAAIGLLLAGIFANQFYVPLLAHLRHAAPVEALGRATALFTLIAVLAIPLTQSAIGLVLEGAEQAGFSLAAGYRLAFGMIGAMIAICGVIYAPSRNVEED